MRLLTTFLIFVLTLTAAAAGSPSLDGAIEAYWNAEFDTAEEALRAIPRAGLSNGSRLEIHKYLALCAVARNRESQALDEFLAALDIDPTFRIDRADVAPPVVKQFEEAQFLALKRSYDQGKQFYLEGRYHEATPYFDIVLQIDPRNEFARSFLELTSHQLGSTPDARR